MLQQPEAKHVTFRMEKVLQQLTKLNTIVYNTVSSLATLPYYKIYKLE